MTSEKYYYVARPERLDDDTLQKFLNFHGALGCRLAYFNEESGRAIFEQPLEERVAFMQGFKEAANQLHPRGR